MDAASFAVAANLVTTLAAMFNAAALAARRASAATASRRTAIAVVACANGGIAIEAAASQAMFAAWRSGASADAFFATGAWTAARLPLLAATLAMTALILRSPR